jgi:Transglutaminase-like superfamily
MKKIVLIMAVLTLTVVLSGCTGYVRQLQDAVAQSSDPVLRRAEPYISPIDTENATLRALAASTIASSSDREYQVDVIYRYIAENYSYYSDPRGREYIQTPGETIAIAGGDCEDLSILLCSLLENIGIRTYLVLTPDHAYCLASGVDPERLRTYAAQSLLEQVAGQYNLKNGGGMTARDGKLYTLKEDTKSTTVKAGYVWYFGGNGSRLESPLTSMDWQYEVRSTSPVTVYCVPSEDDYDALLDGRSFNHFSGSDAYNIVSLTDSWTGMTTSGGLIIKNDGRSDANVTITLKKYTYYNTSSVLKDMPITSYVINNQTCVVLDPTAGKYGYPGYSSYNETGERIAIDPVTKQYFYLSY